MNVKKIMITNAYSYKNKGDAAIIICMLKELNRQFKGTEITISTHDRYDISRKIFGDYSYHPNIQTIVYGTTKSRAIKALRALLFFVRLLIFKVFFRFRPYFLFTADEKIKIKKYEETDLVIACGGGYLITRGKFDIIGTILFALGFYLATFFNKPIILYNQSIGPFGSRFHLPLLKFFLKPAKVIICREMLTYRRLEKAGLKNIMLGADIAFILKPKKDDFPEQQDGEPKVGISVRKWLNESRQRYYENKIKNFIEMMAKKYPKIVFYFIPQVIYQENEDNDLIVSNRIVSKLSGFAKKHTIIISRDLHPGSLMSIIGNMDFFIGTRMHSNIFALSSGVKTIAIAYEPKSFGIMNGLGLGEYVMHMADVTEEKLEKKFEQLKNDKNYLKNLKSAVNNHRP